MCLSACLSAFCRPHEISYFAALPINIYISIPIKEQCVFVCWFVGLSAFYRPHDICPLCGAASEWPRAGSAVVANGPARGGKRMHSESTRAHAVQLLNEKIALYDAFQKQSRTRAHAVVYVTGEISKRKPTCHFPSSVYSLPSLGVFTFRIVLNRILHKSSLLAPWNHGELGDLPSLQRRG